MWVIFTKFAVLQQEMRRIVHISLVCLALSCTTSWATPDVRADQRLELLAAAVQTVVGDQGQLLLTGGSSETHFSVYSITGQLLKVVRVPAATRVAVDLPRGFYIVKCDNLWSRKVVVR